MTHPLTRAKSLQNAAFIRRLEATGNVRLAAAQAGLSYRTMQRRRVAHPGFAQRWDAALAVAQARLGAGAGSGKACRGTRRDGPSTTAPSGAAVPLPEQARGGSREGCRTRGGEAVVVRRRDGTFQVRRAHAGRLTRVAEQAFLAALSATCNVRLAAAAVGAQSTHFYNRRLNNPAFAREMQAALAQGYERVEMALLEGWMPNSHEHDGWRHNEPPAVPAMTANQALQLLYLHQKRVELGEGATKQRRGELGDVHSARLARRYIAQLAEEAEHQLLRQVLANEAGSHVRHEEPPIPPLPALDQVTGWSRADQNKMHVDAGRALFGGWRIGNLTEAQRALREKRRRRSDTR